MIKLIGSDMDGTLLATNKNIDPEFNDIIKKLKEKNIIFVAVSGRDLFSLKKVFEGIEGDIVFAANNGNIIEYKGEILFENYMSQEQIEKIVPHIRKKSKRYTLYCGKDKFYSESLIFKVLARNWDLKIKLVKDITKVDDNFVKITTFGNEKIINTGLENIKHLENEFMIVPSGNTCFDICTIGGTKKNAIEILQKKFNANYDETMVFGDHMNDLEMMESAYYSYAMKNAVDKVKENAKFITRKTNNENGVIETIKEIIFS